MNEQTNTPPVHLMYNPKHPVSPGERYVPVAPYFYSFDVKNCVVFNAADIPSEMDLVVFKSCIITSLEDFVQDYSMKVGEIFLGWEQPELEATLTAQEMSRRVTKEMAEFWIHSARVELEMTQKRVLDWSGTSELIFMFPYVQVAHKQFSPGDIIGQAPKLDLSNCHPKVTGVMFNMRWALG